MNDQTDQSVLKRKAEAGRPRLSFAAMSPAKALRVGLAKAAQDQHRLALIVDKISEDRLSLSELLEVLEERALLAVLTGPAEGLGLAVLSPPVMAALVEMQTMGRVIPGEVPPRRPTRTDATMVVDFIDQVMAELETALASELDVIWAGGFRYSSFLNDPRPLGLLLEDAAYRVFRMELDLSLGAKRGTMLLALPADGRGNPPERRGAAAADPGAQWARNLERTVLAIPAQIEAVLHRLSIPLGTVMGLRAADMLPLPMSGVDKVRLEGNDGRKLVSGRLGQARGYRAVKLLIGDAADLARSMAGAPGQEAGGEKTGGHEAGLGTDFASGADDEGQ